MMEMTKLLDLVDSLKPDSKKERECNILILDGLNTFLRSFAVVKQINSTGHNVGGLVGFLKSLGSTVRMFNPEKIIVTWDGRGGAQNRKNADSNYKAQRLHTGVIHWDLYDTKVEEIDSMNEQISRLQDYLACLPLQFVQIDKLEADDEIAFIVQEASKRGEKSIIVSTDKDFLQLIDENTRVYSPVKKVLYDHTNVVEALQVLPENYNIVKALVGDASDNLAGVKGVGVRGLVKYFPKLVTEVTYSLNDIFEDCASQEKPKAIHTKILADWHHVENNFKIMDLHDTVLDSVEQDLVYKILAEPVTKVNIGRFLQLLDEDRLDFVKDTEGWLCNTFSSVKIS